MIFFHYVERGSSRMRCVCVAVCELAVDTGFGSVHFAMSCTFVALVGYAVDCNGNGLPMMDLMEF